MNEDLTGETNLGELFQSMKPVLNEGNYVFCTIATGSEFDAKDAICTFKEKEGVTVIIQQELADRFHLSYSFVAVWITLTVHSSLQAVGLTAAFSKALSDEGISCNVVAAYYHDHIFVAKEDAAKAMNVLIGLSK